MQTPDGDYCEPQERHLERLKQMDSHARNVLEGMRQRRSWAKAARAKAFEEKRREFREKLTERVSHIHDAHVSVPGLPGAVRRESGLLGAGGPKTLQAAAMRQQPVEKAA